MHPDAAHLAPVVAAAVEQVARHHAFGEDPALVVDVLEEQVDRRQALREAADERAPLGGGDDPGQQVERKDPLGALLVAVDGEGDALGQEGLVRLDLPQRQLPRRGGAELIEEGPVLGPGGGGVEHLVVADPAVVAGKELAR